MVSSQQYTAGTAPSLIAVAPSTGAAGPAGWFYLTNGSGGAVYLGASGVNSSNGAQVPASSTLSGYLFSGDQLYACTAASTSSLGVLLTGA